MRLVRRINSKKNCIHQINLLAVVDEHTVTLKWNASENNP